MKKLIITYLILTGIVGTHHASPTASPQGLSAAELAHVEKEVRKDYNATLNRYNTLGVFAAKTQQALDSYLKNKTQENKTLYDTAVKEEQQAQADYAKNTQDKRTKPLPPANAGLRGAITCNGVKRTLFLSKYTPEEYINGLDEKDKKIVYRGDTYGGTSEAPMDLAGCTLSGVFSGITFKYVNLRGAGLKTAWFKSVTFSNSDMTGASLSAATLDNTHFENVRLFFSHFMWSAITTATFNRVGLQGADMSASTMKSVDFNDCNAEQTDWTDSAFNEVFFDKDSSLAHALFVNTGGPSVGFGTHTCTATTPPIEESVDLTSTNNALIFAPSFEGTAHAQPNLSNVNFNGTRIRALCFEGDETNPLSLIGVSSMKAQTQRVSITNVSYDVDPLNFTQNLECSCLYNFVIEDFKQAAVTGKCPECKECKECMKTEEKYDQI